MLFYPISGMLAADEEGTRATKGGKRGGWYAGELVAGYDVPRVHWEFVLTCSRCQFSSNRIDYIPRLSISFPPSSRIARAHRLLVFVQSNSASPPPFHWLWKITLARCARDESQPSRKVPREDRQILVNRSLAWISLLAPLRLIFHLTTLHRR